MRYLAIATLLILAASVASAGVTDIVIRPTGPAHAGIPIDVRFNAYSSGDIKALWIATDNNETLAKNYGGWDMSGAQKFPGDSGVELVGGFRWIPASCNHTLRISLFGSDGSFVSKAVSIPNACDA